MKICSHCGYEKPLTEFTKRHNRKCGYRAACKQCEKVKYGPAQKAYRDAHREEYKGQTSLWRLKNVYGVSPEWLAEQFSIQNGKCAICMVEFDLSVGKLSPCVDHDHKAGHIRGLLCRNCNRAIGLLKDDPIILLNAAKYLMVN